MSAVGGVGIIKLNRRHNNKINRAHKWLTSSSSSCLKTVSKYKRTLNRNHIIVISIFCVWTVFFTRSRRVLDISADTAPPLSGLCRSFSMFLCSRCCQTFFYKRRKHHVRARLYNTPKHIICLFERQFILAVTARMAGEFNGGDAERTLLLSTRGKRSHADRFVLSGRVFVCVRAYWWVEMTSPLCCSSTLFLIVRHGSRLH